VRKLDDDVSDGEPASEVEPVSDDEAASDGEALLTRMISIFLLLMMLDVFDSCLERERVLEAAGFHIAQTK
jgi:hypothetical protein